MGFETLPPKFITVVVPTRHRDDLLSLCLDRIAPGKQTLPFDYYNVIVTDNGDKQTAEKLIETKYPWAKWVKGPGGGPAHNRNNGAKHATGEWIAFTDDDCIPEPDWLEAYVQTLLASENVLAFEGAVHPTEPLKEEMQACPVNVDGNCFWTANVMINRALFEEIGGFDMTFPFGGGEDQELYFRLKKRTKVPFVAGAKVFHPVRVLSTADALKLLETGSVCWVHFMRLHPQELLNGKDSTFTLTLQTLHARLADLKKRLIRRQFHRAYVALLSIPKIVPMVFAYLQRQDRQRQT